MAAYSSVRGIAGEFDSAEALVPILALPGQAFTSATADATKEYLYYYEAYGSLVFRQNVYDPGKITESIAEGLDYMAV